ncbi:hypothetical protein Sjap_005270 [Stephania japonica]|uniref:Uncharacterized protein n=1 Tax=Stephania japonica TaxID=461633 RepID=A0AAP0K613_9MAGN
MLGYGLAGAFFGASAYDTKVFMISSSTLLTENKLAKIMSSFRPSQDQCKGYNSFNSHPNDSSFLPLETRLRVRRFHLSKVSSNLAFKSNKIALQISPEFSAAPWTFSQKHGP